jgi:predicted DNA-binding protein (UPF0251 family)
VRLDGEHEADDEEPVGMSQTEVARALGISRSRVQRIEARALAKLAEGLDEFVRVGVAGGKGKHR